MATNTEPPAKRQKTEDASLVSSAAPTCNPCIPIIGRLPPRPMSEEAADPDVKVAQLEQPQGQESEDDQDVAVSVPSSPLFLPVWVKDMKSKSRIQREAEKRGEPSPGPSIDPQDVLALLLRYLEIEEVPLNFRFDWTPSVSVTGAGPTSIRKWLWSCCLNLAGALREVAAKRLSRSAKSMSARVFRMGPVRQPHPQYSTLDHVVGLLHRSTKVMVLTGAGISVSAGIPDFRSKGGIYTRLRDEFGMPQPECMFDLRYFASNPSVFFNFAKELWPGNHYPTPTHHFVAKLEKEGKLLRNYSQNIDALEHKAGISRAFQCHGSFATATCVSCGFTVQGEAIHEDIMDQTVAKCPKCHPASSRVSVPRETLAESSHTGTANGSSDVPGIDLCLSPPSPPDHRPLSVSQLLKLRMKDPNHPCYGAMKPDIVFFGEDLPKQFHRLLRADLEECDLLIVMGSSLKVSPVATIVGRVQAPAVLINCEVVGKPNKFDIELLGYCDTVCSELARLMDWSLPQSPQPVTKQPARYEFHPPNRYIFEGGVMPPERKTPGWASPEFFGRFPMLASLGADSSDESDGDGDDSCAGDAITLAAAGATAEPSEPPMLCPGLH